MGSTDSMLYIKETWVKQWAMLVPVGVKYVDLQQTGTTAEDSLRSQDWHLERGMANTALTHTSFTKELKLKQLCAEKKCKELEKEGCNS